MTFPCCFSNAFVFPVLRLCISVARHTACYLFLFALLSGPGVWNRCCVSSALRDFLACGITFLGEPDEPANREQMVRGNSIIVIEALERASK